MTFSCLTSNYKHFTENVTTTSTASTTVDGNGLLTTVSSPEEGQASSLAVVLVVTSLVAVGIIIIISGICIAVYRRKYKRGHTEKRISNETQKTEYDKHVFGTTQQSRVLSASGYDSVREQINTAQTSTAKDDADFYETIPDDHFEMNNKENQYELPVHTNSHDYVEVVT